MPSTTVEPPTLPPRFVRPNIGDDPERRRQYERATIDSFIVEVHDPEEGLLSVARMSTLRAISQMGVAWHEASLCYARFCARMDMELATATESVWSWSLGHEEICPGRIGHEEFGKFIQSLRSAIGGRTLESRDHRGAGDAD